MSLLTGRGGVHWHKTISQKNRVTCSPPDLKTGPRGPRSLYNKRCTMLRGPPGSTSSLELVILERWQPGSRKVPIWGFGVLTQCCRPPDVGERATETQVWLQRHSEFSDFIRLFQHKRNRHSIGTGRFLSPDAGTLIINTVNAKINQHKMKR